MRHRNTEMVIKVYSKYIENAAGFSDGAAFNEVIQVSKGTIMKHRKNGFWAKMAPLTKKGLNHTE